MGNGQFEIHSLRLGELYLPHGDGIMRDPVHVWLITDGTTHILADSGMPEIAEVTRTLNVGGKGGGHDSLRATLAEHGLKPGDIQQIIITHMHFDHAANLELFPDAQILVQRDEVFHAVDPTPSQRPFFRRQILAELMGRKRPRQLVLLDGDHDVMPGIRILHVPSHTPGMQVPVVTTAKGRAAMVSDLGDHYKYWYPADPRATRKPMRYLSDTFMAGPIRSESERMWCGAMRRVMDNTDIVIPAHDFRIPKHMPEEWFAVPESNDGDIAHQPPEG